MDNIAFEDFHICFDPNKVLEVDSSEILNKNIKFFNSQSIKFIERIRLNYYELEKSHNNPNYYLIDIVEKLNIIKNELFISRKGVVLFRSKPSIIVIPIKEGNLFSEAANAQFCSLRNIIEHFNSHLSGNNFPPKTRSKDGNFGAFPNENRRKRERIPTEPSFVLSHANVDLTAVHEILTNNNFIASSYGDFAQVFSGDPVANKVIWNEANALQYFIKNIYSGDGIKKPNEGKWERTIKCFKKPDGDYRIEDLKDTHEPVATVTLILDRATELINNPR
jgi:hypothetical protein